MPLHGATIFDRIEWNSKPPSHNIQGEAARMAKTLHFPMFDLGEGKCRFSIYFVHDCSCYSMGMTKAELENGSNLPIFNCSAGGGILPSSYTFFGLYKLNTIG